MYVGSLLSTCIGIILDPLWKFSYYLLFFMVRICGRRKRLSNKSVVDAPSSYAFTWTIKDFFV